MKTRLSRLIQIAEELRDKAGDEELSDELDNAIIHLESARDRLIHLEEEENSEWEFNEDEDEDKDEEEEGINAESILSVLDLE